MVETRPLFANAAARWLAMVSVLVGVSPATFAVALTPPPNHIDTNANLKLFSGTDTVLVRDGFWSSGDSPPLTHGKAGATCTVTDAAGSPGDNATQVQGTSVCWVLQGPIPTDVRAWGARCDVTVVQSSNMAYDPVNNNVIVPTNSAVPTPTSGEFITVSQIGGPTIWTKGTDATWATRTSMVSAGGSGYQRGDLVAFEGNGPHGLFSQQIAIIVDTVKTVTVGSIVTTGIIDQWHFLWSGLYKTGSGNLPGSPMIVDTLHSYVAGGAAATGAQFTPDWAGWRLQNNQSLPAAGAGANYVVGDIITFNNASGCTATTCGIVYGSHYPSLIVETVDAGTGAVTSYDWLDYGSFSQLPADPLNLSLGTPHGSGTSFAFVADSVQWTRGPLATTINGTPTTSGGNTLVHLTDASGFAPTSGAKVMGVNYLYYGHDDGAAINTALASGVMSRNSSAVELPGRCGTTIPINLPEDESWNNLNPALIGKNFESTGLYAFAWNVADRIAVSGVHGIQPVLNRVLYKGYSNSFGGGFRNIKVEGGGVPEGFGYYGLYQNKTAPTGYNGPPPSATTPVIPSNGNVVEVDAGKYIRIADVQVTNAMGTGNAILACGLDETFPDPAVQIPKSGHVGNIIVSDSRFDGNSTLSGPINPDFALKLGNSCHDSVFQSLTAYDGTKADILQYNGNLFSRTHVNSDAANSPAGAAGTIDWTGHPLAGVADYGVYAFGNTSLSQTQCDIANVACVRMASNPVSAKNNPGQITDTQLKCGSLSSVSSSFSGAELPDGAINTSVSGTVAANSCNIAGSQLVRLDGAIASTVSLCNNSNATVATCAPGLGGFATGQSYTSPATTFGTFTTPTAGGILYAIPFVSPLGGPISKMSIFVTAAGTATKCRLGVYGVDSGAPGALLLDAGDVTLSGTGVQQKLGLNFLLSPNALYFLALGCDKDVTLEAGGATGNLSGMLGGLAAYDKPNVNISVAWTYGSLPPAFGTPTYTPGTVSVPVNMANVYVQR